MSPYQCSREIALSKTKEQNYKKHTKARDFDEETIGFCIAKNIDYKKLQHRVGTAMQHQLYDEVADCYKKIAKFFCQATFGESVLAQHSLDFAQGVVQATDLEAIELAIALSDVAHCCTNMVCWVASEAKETICDFAKMLRNDPLCPIKDFAFLVGKVMNDIAEAMLHADSESLGWSYYAQVLEDEHCYDAQYAQQVIDTIQFWVENSSAEEKTKVATRFVIDFALYGRYFKMLSHAGRTCSSLIAQTPEIRFLESFADVYAEHKLLTNLGDVGLNSMEGVGTSLMQGEFEAVRYGNVIKIRSFDTALQELQTYGARCKLFQRELNTWFDNIFYKNELLNFYKDFKCPLCVKVIHRGESAKLFCDLEHLMTYNLKFKLKKNTGLIEGFISGGHVGTYTKALEKAGEIVILSEQILI